MICELCQETIEVGDWPAEMCKGKGGHKMSHHRFTPVEVDLGKLGKHTVNSFADFARLERKHLKETGQEVSFRAFNNRVSNQDSNSMGEGPAPKKFSTRNRRGQPFITQRGGKYKG